MARYTKAMIQSQLEVDKRITDGHLTAWCAKAYLELCKKVSDEAFPCTFGTIALKKRQMVLAFIESTEDATVLDGLVRALTEYAAFIETEPLVSASMHPLAILMPPPARWQSIEDYYHNSWRLLTAVRRRDPRPWPARIPAEPDSPGWCFCFGGVPFFINFKTPYHEHRRSRRMRLSYLWLVQARDGFDMIAGDTDRGRKARRLIREKLASYDGLPIYPELGHYGRPDNREWKQYFVPETNELITTACPFSDRER